MTKYIISELGFKKISKIVTCASGRKVVPGTARPEPTSEEETRAHTSQCKVSQRKMVQTAGVVQ